MNRKLLERTESRLCKEIKKIITGEARQNEPMSAHTSFGIGGPADVWASPENMPELFALLDMCEVKGIPYKVIGRGSNLLVRDGGLSGVVISLSGACRNLSAAENRITAGAGVSLSRLLGFSQERGLQGLEFLAGIPGSVGGGLATNAGAWGSSLGQMLATAIVYDPKKSLTKRIEKAETAFGYRKSDLPSMGVIVEAEFELRPADPAEISDRIEEYRARRRRTQPLGSKSAGSVFKNPAGHYAGALIECLGFKGYACGDAVVSELHANFILNAGTARASDVLSIIAEIKRRAVSEKGVELEEEIEVIGRD